MQLLINMSLKSLLSMDSPSRLLFHLSISLQVLIEEMECWSFRLPTVWVLLIASPWFYFTCFSVSWVSFKVVVRPRKEFEYDVFVLLDYFISNNCMLSSESCKCLISSLFVILLAVSGHCLYTLVRSYKVVIFSLIPYLFNSWNMSIQRNFPSSAIRLPLGMNCMKTAVRSFLLLFISFQNNEVDS